MHSVTTALHNIILEALGNAKWQEKEDRVQLQKKELELSFVYDIAQEKRLNY